MNLVTAHAILSLFPFSFVIKSIEINPNSHSFQHQMYFHFRYWAVTNVDYIHARTTNRVCMMILLVWVSAVIVSLAPQFGWKDPEYMQRIEQQKCMVSQDIGYQVRLILVCPSFKPFFSCMNRIDRGTKVEGPMNPFVFAIPFYHVDPVFADGIHRIHAHLSRCTAHHMKLKFPASDKPQWKASRKKGDLFCSTLRLPNKTIQSLKNGYNTHCAMRLGWCQHTLERDKNDEFNFQ